MKAQIIENFGGPEVFRPADIETPTPAAGEVLIRVHATSVNPLDTKIRAGGRAIAPDLPAVLHGDVAGVVEAAGAEVTAFQPGDAVYGCAGGLKGSGGALAEFMAADARLLAPKPARLSFREAAALPLVSLTAWEGLIDKARLAGEGTDHPRVLVFGGTGGVGHVALQLAKLHGAEVFATVASEAKARIVRELGADAAIDRRATTPEQMVAQYADDLGFDIVFDSAGGDNLYAAMTAARPHGQVITTLAMQTFDLTTAHMKGLSIHVVFMLVPLLTGIGRAHHGDILRRVAAEADAGRLRPLVDPATFTLEQAGEAHAHLESGRAVGKVVIDVA